jgi:predicted DNA-binding transcriptional regulator AlpA
MAGGELVPFELRAIDAEGVSALLGLSPRTVLEKVACRADFPVRVTARPATWVAGEVLAWREVNRAGLPIPRRRRRSRSSGS